MKPVISRGDIFRVNLGEDLGEVVGSEERGKARPCLVIQNDVANERSAVVIVAAITSRPRKKKYPHEVQISTAESGLHEDSTVMLSQIRTVDKSRLIQKAGKLSQKKMMEIDEALKISLGLF